jgi:hypothetical protein
MLSIPEKVFLLNFYEKRNGSIQQSKSPYLSYGLIAGSLLELILSGRMALNSSRKVLLTNTKSETKFVPEELLRHISYEKEAKRASFWIEALGHKRKRVEEDFLKLFSEKNILIRDGQICHFHPDMVTPPTAKFSLKEEIRKQVLGKEELNCENFAVLKIMSSVHMLDQIFTSDEIKPIHVYVDQLSLSGVHHSLEPSTADGFLNVLESLKLVVNGTKG